MLKRTSRRGFSLTELLTAAGIVILLFSLLLPALQSARESARQVHCKNNLKQIGLALHNYHDLHRQFPAGWIGVDAEGYPEVSGPSGWGWAAMVLPQLDEQELFADIEFGASILDPVNESASQSVVKKFLCPSDPSPQHSQFLAADGSGFLASLPRSNYVGNFGAGSIDYCENLIGKGLPCDSSYSLDNAGAFLHNSRISLASLLDGSSQTLLISERSAASSNQKDFDATWTGVLPDAENPFGRNLGSIGYIPNLALNHRQGFSSEHPGLIQMLMGDGHVRSISVETSNQILLSIASSSGDDGASGFGGYDPGYTFTTFSDGSGSALSANGVSKSAPPIPNHTPGDPDSEDHFIHPLPDGRHGSMGGFTPDSEGPLTIKYDFRDLDGFPNMITEDQKAVVEQAFDLWAAATCGKLVFEQDSSAPDSEVIIVGTGDLAVRGEVSEPGGILGFSSSQVSDTTMFNSMAWMDMAETWDTTIGNGDPPGTFDYFTVLAHELGHAIGIGHLGDLPGDNLMNPFYDGEQLELSSSDIEILLILYGTDCGGTPPPGPGPGDLPAGWISP